MKINVNPIICVVGARPNFMKMAPILRAFLLIAPHIPVVLVHTGQHYDNEMNDQLFVELNLPNPDVNLGVGSGSHAIQTSDVMRKFEPVLDQYNPQCIIVVGDVNSTLACALVAIKKGIPVAHVEAGLRSNDRSMPEEINRILTDQISDKLYITERNAEINLLREGINSEKILFVGNVMIDSLLQNRHKSKNLPEILSKNKVYLNNFNQFGRYGVITMHRPSNVDDENNLKEILEIFSLISLKIPLIFALHPRTKNNIEKFDLLPFISNDNIVLLPPQGYLEMLGLMDGATFILTDSGGLQEESTALGVPCLTLRDNTERPITITEGTNTLVGINRLLILSEVDAILSGKGKNGLIPEFWDGNASERIVNDIVEWLN